MFNEILIGGTIATVSGVIGFMISKKLITSNFDLYTDQAKAKAGAIENEAHTLLEKSTLKAQEIESEAMKHYQSAKERAKEDLHQRENSVYKKKLVLKSIKRMKKTVLILKILYSMLEKLI